MSYFRESASGMTHVPYLTSLSSTPLPELPASSGHQDLRLGSYRVHQEESVVSDGAATSPIKCERLEEDGDVCMEDSPTDDKNCSGSVSEQVGCFFWGGGGDI